MFAFRSCFAHFTPYESGKSLFEGTAKVFLDTNENPFSTDYNRYPSASWSTLRESIALVKNKQFASSLSLKNIALGNGSDELIDLMVRLFCEPNQDSILITPPTFGMYAVAARLNQVEILEIPLQSSSHESFLFPIEDVLIAIHQKKPKLVFLCTPNNPTGNSISYTDIIRILQTGVMTILDEAYIDFSPWSSLLPDLHCYPNAIVLHTFSKMWGLAGMRCGVVMAHQQIIEKIMALKMPYNINSATGKIVKKYLETPSDVFVQRDAINKEKDRIEKEYKKCSCVETIFPSDANFLLIRFYDADLVFATLMQQGIVVRNFSHKPYLQNCLRITIGTPTENDFVLRVLQSL